MNKQTLWQYQSNSKGVGIFILLSTILFVRQRRLRGVGSNRGQASGFRDSESDLSDIPTSKK